MRSVKPHPFPRQTFLLLQWTALRGLQKYALNEEKHLPLDWMQCQVNQEFSTWRISAPCVLETHYLWVLEVKSLFNEIQLSRNSLETPAGTPRENDKTGLAQRDAWNKITTVKISRGKKQGSSCERESVWHEERGGMAKQVAGFIRGKAKDRTQIQRKSLILLLLKWFGFWEAEEGNWFHSQADYPTQGMFVY